MLLGAHVSTAGGLVQAIHNAVALDVNVIQIFGSSPVRWKAGLPDEDVIETFKKERKAKGVERVYLHAPYLINLASEKPATRHLSRVLLADNLRISNAIGADGVIYHTGSAGTQKEADARKIAVDAVRRILDEVPEGNLIVENAAGAGALIGDTVDEVAYMLDVVNNKRFGMCLDTCHALASGMLADFESATVAKFEKELKGKIGEKKLFAIHVNDSKFPYNSKRDRHENIGEGHIGLEGFKNFFARKTFRSVPLILEVPGFANTGPDEKNVQLLRSIL
jgi:deoxyribonuclease-4